MHKTIQDGQSAGHLTKTVSHTVHFNYLLYLPEDYGKTDKKWPLMLFLHGLGESGDDIEQVKLHGPPKLAAEGRDFDFILLSPQCPKGNWWPQLTDDLMVLVDEIADHYQADTQKMYVTGMSMGGFGTWSIIEKYPDKFAAAAPICGGGDIVMAKFRLSKIPIWVFHGAKDDIIPLSQSQQMVDAVKAAGNHQVQFTIYPEAKHNSWTQTYSNPELYRWFLSHKKQ